MAEFDNPSAPMNETQGDPSARNTPAPPRRRAIAAAGVLIVLAGVLAYHNSLGGPFIFDDPGSIAENPTIRSLWPIWPVLSPPGGGVAVQSRPIINLSLAVNYAIGGLDVRGYHVLNLAVHLLAALALFGVIRRTLRLAVIPGHIAAASLPLAFVAALIWTVHPLATEAVTYIIQRCESMMGLFYLLTLYCVIRGAAASHSARWYVAAVAACALGVGCKEVAATAPLIVLVYDRVFLARSFKQVFARRWPLYVGLAATWVLLAALVLPVMSMGGSRGGFGGLIYWKVLRSYALTQSIMIMRYLGLCFWPDPLILDYGILPTGAVALSVPQTIAMVVLLGGTVTAFRNRAWLGFLGVWFFGILAPSSSFVPLLIQPAAEKRMYLPLAAVIVVVVLGTYALGRRLWDSLGVSGNLRGVIGRLGGLALAGGVALTLGVVTVRRNDDYRSELVIWDDTIAKQPNNYRAWLNRGTAYGNMGSHDKEAISDLDKAIELNPYYAMSYHSRGFMYLKKRRYDKSIADFTKAIELKRDYAQAYHDRAMTHFLKDDYKKAREDLEAAQALGYKAKPEFLTALGKASARN